MLHHTLDLAPGIVTPFHSTMYYSPIIQLSNNLRMVLVVEPELTSGTWAIEPQYLPKGAIP
jgi:hypothetical protein